MISSYCNGINNSNDKTCLRPEQEDQQHLQQQTFRSGDPSDTMPWLREDNVLLEENLLLRVNVTKQRGNLKLSIYFAR